MHNTIIFSILTLLLTPAVLYGASYIVGLGMQMGQLQAKLYFMKRSVAYGQKERFRGPETDLKRHAGSDAATDAERNTKHG